MPDVDGPAALGGDEQPLYQVDARFTDVSEYGVSFPDLLAGAATVPPAGARFDVAYTGTLSGPRLNGRITGLDYLNVRADGRIELHVHGRLVTTDGAGIAFTAEGVATMQGSAARAHETVTLHSAAPDYAWMNGLAVCARTEIDPSAGTIRSVAWAI